MRTQKPPVLNSIERIQRHLHSELRRRELRTRFKKNADASLGYIHRLLSDQQVVEQFIREHIPEDQWKGILG